MKSKKINSITIIYDEQCPLCSDYVAFTKLRSVFEDVILINAREAGNPHVKKFMKSGCDFNSGMLVILNDKYYFGDQAVWILSSYTNPTGILSYISLAILRNKMAAKIVYPVMRAVRRLTLYVLGIPTIQK